MKLRLDRVAPDLLKWHDVPSVAVAFIRDGRLDWTAVYGEQSPGVAATDKTLYNVASLTKPISAEILLRLASRGKLSLDEPMSTAWLDPDVRDNPWALKLTPRLALSHQTGFTNWRYETNNVLKFQWEPGTKTAYSGEGYNYAARFAEKKLGRPFEALAQEYVFDPMGMKDTAYTERDWYAGRLAVGRGPKDGGKELGAPKEWNAADLLRTTVSDYARFVAGVMRDEGLSREIASQRLTITRDAMPELRPKGELTLAYNPERIGFGLGWEVQQFAGETVINHTGSDPRVRTLAFFVPKRCLGIVVFTNGDNGNKVIRDVVSLLYDNPAYLAILALQAR